MAQSFFVEARSYFARVHELPCLVIANQQCAESYPPSLRVGVPTNHEFLFLSALELEPLTRSLRNIDAVAILGDDSLPSLTACVPVVRYALSFPVCGKTNWALKFERVPQHLFSLVQWKLAQVIAF